MVNQLDVMINTFEIKTIPRLTIMCIDLVGTSSVTYIRMVENLRTLTTPQTSFRIQRFNIRQKPNSAQGNNSTRDKLPVGGNWVSNLCINNDETVTTTLYHNNTDDNIRNIYDKINISEGADNDNDVLDDLFIT